MLSDPAALNPPGAPVSLHDRVPRFFKVTERNWAMSLLWHEQCPASTAVSAPQPCWFQDPKIMLKRRNIRLVLRGLPEQWLCITVREDACPDSFSEGVRLTSCLGETISHAELCYDMSKVDDTSRACFLPQHLNHVNRLLLLWQPSDAVLTRMLGSVRM